MGNFQRILAAVLTAAMSFLPLSARGDKEFTVLQWNIWQEGTVVPGGYEAIADERDRIDYVFYHPHPSVVLKEAVIFGPDGSIVKSRRVKETSRDRFLLPLGVWPTDHKGLLVTFGLKR